MDKSCFLNEFIDNYGKTGSSLDDLEFMLADLLSNTDEVDGFEVDEMSTLDEFLM